MTTGTVGRALIGVGIAGVLLSIFSAVVGLRLVGQMSATVEAGAAVAAETVDLSRRSLTDAEASTRQLEQVLADAEDLLAATADLSEEEVAGSVAAVDDALPALIEVAAVIDRTLATLAALPFGPDYDPAEPFDDSLRRVQRELEGLPADLRAQAALIRAAGTGLGAARSDILDLAEDLRGLEAALATADELVTGYAGEGPSPRRGEALGDRLSLARMLIVGLAATAAAANVVPLLVGWLLLRPGPSADPGGWPGAPLNQRPPRRSV